MKVRFQHYQIFIIFFCWAINMPADARWIYMINEAKHFPQLFKQTEKVKTFNCKNYLQLGNVIGFCRKNIIGFPP